jgi:hypothetical protein
VATESDELWAHLREAEDLAETAAVNVIGGTGEARLCELGVLHALIALTLTMLRGQQRVLEARERRAAERAEREARWMAHEDPANRGPVLNPGGPVPPAEDWPVGKPDRPAP